MPDDATLARFVEAQANAYDTALSEIRAGAKQSHWMLRGDNYGGRLSGNYDGR